ncbi:M23 family metallopeptidase [Nitratireductor aquimarinus]|uniref:M23 family metallopeptidase n=1 Tax=Alphaproteobacteria TaxID=28211 RepID=UPI0019D409B1|nr:MULTISPECIES: M23 family metallopeptidase [Alphaproteobacteria]MBY6022484.1 M23 family metallopeptidase [Nitratireductor sp. DP7N14-4]MBN7757693.1 M23 family metallopeptidase [Nitratireductor aquimarinus]MBN7762158.1 M23 family metallopeptidase [Nitratireductor aquibiodomus]MBN7778119.1 M23 family metallopeptidase [Nitratireductor pacificus]MBN7782441.1 M23 family metallopeptidase [Nitratireductor pacificus]
MNNNKQIEQAIGEDDPLIADGRSGPPDRREISARWLIGTFLTGVTSTVLMGVALSAALDGRQQLATPPEIALLGEIADPVGEAAKTGRLVTPHTISRGEDRRMMEVSTVMRSGDTDLIRTLPFVHAKMALTASHTTDKDYPPFDPLAVFAEDGATSTARTGLIYGAKVESEVSLKSGDFPLWSSDFSSARSLSTEEVEVAVRNTGAILTDGDVQVASLHYVDPQRFGDTLSTQALAAFSARIIPENVSVAARSGRETTPEFAEDLIPFRTERAVAEVFTQSGYKGEDVDGMVEAITKLLNATELKAGTLLRVGIETHGVKSRVVRTSIYEGKKHIVTIALDDRDQYVPAQEPEMNPVLLAAFDHPTAPRRMPRSDLPRVYDGIYRASYAYGLTPDMTKRLVKLLSADVDFQSRLSPADQLEVFFSAPDADKNATDQSELLYVKASFGGATRTFYRFQFDDGTVDYFDEEGRSSKRFMIRNPVPNGRFTSGFGMRRHPVLGYSKMHTGVDWAAPRGTPIIAAGDGVVEKAGWAGGYGRQTIIRHNNGFKTSYNHQSGIAKGVTTGARIRQGQVIGYVGATGLVTGNHLHYEMIVNGTKVDPMRVRLPDNRALKGKDLLAFERERSRIDELLQENDETPLSVAASGS